MMLMGLLIALVLFPILFMLFAFWVVVQLTAVRRARDLLRVHVSAAAWPLLIRHEVCFFRGWARSTPS